MEAYFCKVGLQLGTYLLVCRQARFPKLGADDAVGDAENARGRWKGMRYVEVEITALPDVCSHVVRFQEEGVKKAEDKEVKPVRKTKKQLAKERLTNGASA